MCNECCSLLYCTIYFILLHMKPRAYVMLNSSCDKKIIIYWLLMRSMICAVELLVWNEKAIRWKVVWFIEERIELFSLTAQLYDLFVGLLACFQSQLAELAAATTARQRLPQSCYKYTPPRASRRRQARGGARRCHESTRSRVPVTERSNDHSCATCSCRGTGTVRPLADDRDVGPWLVWSAWRRLQPAVP